MARWKIFLTAPMSHRTADTDFGCDFRVLSWLKLIMHSASLRAPVRAPVRAMESHGIGLKRWRDITMSHSQEEDKVCARALHSGDESHRLKAKLVLMSSILPAAIHHALLYHKATGFARLIQDTIQELRIIHSSNALDGGIEDLPQYLVEIIDGAAAELLESLKAIRALPAYDRVEDVCINRLVHDFFHNEFSIGAGKGVHINLIVENDQRLYVRANPWGLRQALQILAENAVQAMEKTSTKNLVVSVHATDTGCAIIRLKDTGHGISTELLDKLFKAAITNENKRGIGLGAALAAIIIDGYDGVISIEDNSEMGATISVSLPRYVA
jgi:signal transduction histidine kinase